MYKHILLPTDGSALANGAVQAGVKLAKSLGATDGVNAKEGDVVAVAVLSGGLETEEAPLFERYRLAGEIRILDAGCGEGYFPGIISSHFPEADIRGVDISVPAIDAAARKYPNVRWLVANA